MGHVVTGPWAPPSLTADAGREGDVLLCDPEAWALLEQYVATSSDWRTAERTVELDQAYWDALEQDLFAPAPAPAAAAPASEAVRWAVPGVWDADDTQRAAAEAALPPASPQVQALADAVACLASVDPLGLPEPQALADVDLLLAATEDLRRVVLRRLADVDSRDLHAVTGRRTAAVWLRSEHPDVDPRDLRLAKDLTALPALDQAVQAGRVSLRAARLVSKALGAIRHRLDHPSGQLDDQPADQVVPAVVGHVTALVCELHRGLSDQDPLLLALQAEVARIQDSPATDTSKVEAAFTLLAEHLPARDLPRGLDELVCALLPSILDDRERRARDKAALTLTPEPDGEGYRISGRLDLECAELLWTALRSECGRDPANPTDTRTAAALRAAGHDPYADPPTPAASRGAAPPGDLPDPLDDPAPEPWSARPRSKAVRLHDALKNLLQRYLERGLGGTRDKTPVQVVLTATTDLLDRWPGARPTRADSGQLLPFGTLTRQLCDARITSLVLSPGGKALRQTLTTRTLPALHRRALDVETGKRCAGDSCCTPGDPTTVLTPHHVHSWHSTGTTTLTDTLWACQTLHHDLHEGHKTIRLRNGQLLNEHGWT